MFQILYQDFNGEYRGQLALANVVVFRQSFRQL